MPQWSDAVDPGGKHFVLSPQEKEPSRFSSWLPLGDFEVVPIGVILIAMCISGIICHSVNQDAFRFYGPVRHVIFASVVVGSHSQNQALPNDLPTKCFRSSAKEQTWSFWPLVVTADSRMLWHTLLLRLRYSHTPSVNSLYGEGDKTDKFGKSLFIGMAYAAGAGTSSPSSVPPCSSRRRNFGNLPEKP